MAWKSTRMLALVVLGGLLGGAVGELLAAAAPPGTIRSFFNVALTPGISPFTVDLVLLKLTFGCSLKVSLLAILGMLLGAYLGKRR
jgi:uncharacterized membrane protein YfcA